jgi:hypothetical protein
MNADRLSKLYRRLAALHASQARLFEELAEELDPPEPTKRRGPPPPLIPSVGDLDPAVIEDAKRELRRLGRRVRSDV